MDVNLNGNTITNAYFDDIPQSELLSPANVDPSVIAAMAVGNVVNGPNGLVQLDGSGDLTLTSDLSITGSINFQVDPLASFPFVISSQGGSGSSLGDFVYIPDTVMGGLFDFVGLYDAGTGNYYGITPNGGPAANGLSNICSLGGFYSGLCVGGLSSQTGAYLFGVLDNNPGSPNYLVTVDDFGNMAVTGTISGDGASLSNVLHPGDTMDFDGGAIYSDGSGNITANSFIGDGSGLTGFAWGFAVAYADTANAASYCDTAGYAGSAGSVATASTADGPSASITDGNFITTSGGVFADSGTSTASLTASFDASFAYKPVVSGYSYGHTGAVSSVVTTTTPSDGTYHTYRIGCGVSIISVATDVLQVQVAYIDFEGNSQTLVLNSQDQSGTSSSTMGATGTYVFPEVTIGSNANSPITIKTVLVTGGGSIWYDIYAYIQQVF